MSTLQPPRFRKKKGVAGALPERDGEFAVRFPECVVDEIGPYACRLFRLTASIKPHNGLRVQLRGPPVEAD